MAWTVDEQVQRGHHFAIIDEVGSILIDEACTHLIVSGQAAGEANRLYGAFSRILINGIYKDNDVEV